MPELSQYALRDVLAVSASVAAVFFDARSRRIPNALTYGAAALALLLLTAAAVSAGEQRWGVVLRSGLLGGAVLFGLFGALSSFGLLGTGDTKLLGAIGLCVGLPLSLRVAICVLLAGGALAIVQALRLGRLNAVLGNVLRPDALRDRAVTDAPRRLHLFGYAAAIALGTAWAVLGRYYPVLLPL